LSYDGTLFNFDSFVLSGAYQRLDTHQGLKGIYSYYNRNIESKRYNFNGEKGINYKLLDIHLAYQFESTNLNYRNERQIQGEEIDGVANAEFLQQKHGLASIVKFHAPTTDNFFNTFDIDLSYRFDHVHNDQNNMDTEENVQGNSIPGIKEWQKSTIKFSTQLSGKSKSFRFDSFMNFGSNVKFPSLFQQLSTPRQMTEGRASTTPNLYPETNLALEIGSILINDFLRKGILDSWQLSLNYFKNEYENKFRMYRLPYNPITFYDNVQTASISGIDINGKLFLYNKKITFEIGASNYDVSARDAFPFKYDMKNILKVRFDYANYAFDLYLFREGDQIGIIRTADGLFQEIILPAYSNMDIHMSKTFQYKRVKLFINTSARNILDSDMSIEGIAIRDRRYYLTFGAQY